MSKRSRKNSQKVGIRVKAETKHSILMVVFFALALFSILASFGIAGVAGDFFYRIFDYLLGFGYFLFPLILIILGTLFIKEKAVGYLNFTLLKLIGAVLFVLSGLGLIDAASLNHSGGVLGKIFAYPFLKLFDLYIGILFIGAILIISIILVFDRKPQLIPLWQKITLWFGTVFSRKKEEEGYEIQTGEDEEYEEKKIEEPEEENGESNTDVSAQTDADITQTVAEEIEEALTLPSTSPSQIGGEKSFASVSRSYSPPPLKLLERDRGKPNVGDIKANANTIKRTLQNFGIEVEMDEITIGPTITRYTIKPAEGVRLSKIIALNNDLALALAAHPIRIEAPIPGRSLVGIEIPNKIKSTVGLASLLSNEAFKDADKPLVIALGRRLSGKPLFVDMARMPHMLIGGATGSGKSVLIHSIITSLLYRNSPQNLHFIMVDPKRVELTLYNDIPHLLTPVITDAKKTILALRWAATEMERRYDILESEKVRDIISYNKKVSSIKKKKTDTEYKIQNTEYRPMPYIVIMIDELADIMSTYPRELESAIVRLAQMSRAVGIHLVLSTQRPSVNVITGLIKANIPTRIALLVSSQIDSRTILDMGGAEKLVGAGDMLYMSGEMSKPERIQSAFISEEEVKKVVKYLKNQFEGELTNEISFSDPSTTSDLATTSLEEDDELYSDAKETVIAADKASTSYLQRKLKIGYSRAARLIDMLEERGVVGPQDGSKPREILGLSPSQTNADLTQTNAETDTKQAESDNIDKEE